MAQTPAADEPNAASESTKPAEQPEPPSYVEDTGQTGDYGDYAREWSALYTQFAEDMVTGLRGIQELLATAVRPADAESGEVRIPPMSGLLGDIQ